ncbi:hypothetical protein [Pilimelia columellifera]|uniref:Uncharacterized protein n=1 Tax=Pilimelia columellifera subsp. columellifera TaxID=706583 RepID=A0ABP6AID1_9ACTN
MTPQRTYVIVSLINDVDVTAAGRARAGAVVGRQRSGSADTGGDMSVLATAAGAGRHRIGTPGLRHFGLFEAQLPGSHRAAGEQPRLARRTAAATAAAAVVVSGWYAASGTMTLITVIGG